jgi:hypothetical protein
MFNVKQSKRQWTIRTRKHEKIHVPRDGISESPNLLRRTGMMKVDWRNERVVLALKPLMAFCAKAGRVLSSECLW